MSKDLTISAYILSRSTLSARHWLTLDHARACIRAADDGSFATSPETIAQVELAAPKPVRPATKRSTRPEGVPEKSCPAPEGSVRY